MWTLQGLLFGAATIMWSSDWRGVAILSVVGLVSCIFIGYSLARGLKAIKELLRIAADTRAAWAKDSGFRPPLVQDRRRWSGFSRVTSCPGSLGLPGYSW